ncbi:Concanavalin A-like lectin/glucanases superfamily protein [Flavobacterium segetis]|uniref:Concanavalin A-like lectin/glucanases superfamily protein n=1 Tax=Flavobacterium segetis TaxID=271157 RepID=A0A1M5HP46_9FLAO|nr:LamG-like jellyroll fold domain-containing protein [Flavobacterium segetis]SHG17715.1 Concanavalin A-like lectin/glucanases superfamily protein [Flavobacterium segetis]
MKINKYSLIFSCVLLSQFFVSCDDENIDKTNAPIAYEAIGGYASSDDIAATDLVSKFSFENNLTDSKGSINNIIGNNIGYSAGVKGIAYNGSSSQERYFTGTATTAVTGLNSFTVSFWMNTANTVDPAVAGQGKGAQGIFSIVRPTEFWGALNVFMENPDSAFPNRIRLKINLENGRNGVAWGSWGPIVNIDNNINKWMHVVFSYDASKSVFSAYINGELAPNLGSFPYAPSAGVNGSTVFYADNPGSINNSNNAPKYGNFQMTGTNGKVVFGTHPFETTPALNNVGQQDWATSYAGLLDEFRIYKSALASSDVRFLYKLESDGR